MGVRYHEVQVNVVDAQALERGLDALFDALVPRVVTERMNLEKI